MNFNHDSGAVVSLLSIDTTVAPPLGGSNTLHIIGTGGIVLPSGTTAQRPSTGLAAGTVRWNTDTSKSETFTGSAWTSDLGGTVTSITIDTTTPSALTVSNGTVSTTGTVSLALDAELVQLAAITAASAGPVIRNSDGSYTQRVLQTSGTGISVSNGDGAAGNPTYSLTGELPKLATADVSSISTTGALYRASNGNYTARQLVGAGSVSVTTNGAGNIEIGYSPDVNLGGLTSSTTGIVVQTGDGTYADVSITGAVGQIAITNGSGVLGNPVISLATVSQGSSGSFVKIATDTYGRVTGTAAVTSSDITGLVDSIYVNTGGDTMSGNLAFGGSATVTGLTSPTTTSDAATKGYVDSLVSGLSWKQAVDAVGTTNPGSGSTGSRFLNTTDGKIYTYASGSWGAGVAPVDGDSVFDRTDETGYVYSGSAWTQFTGTGQIAAGVGLSKSGNVLSVNLGAGIAQLPTDEVSIDIHAGSALFLTEDGSTAATTTASALALRTGAGLSQDTTSGVYISSGAISNAMLGGSISNDKLSNSTVTISGNAGSDAVALGETISVSGSGAVSTAVGSNSVTISVATATSSVLGVASFNTTDFAVSSGAVSVNARSADWLTDVDTTGKATGDLLSWNGTNWAPISQQTVAPALSVADLTDVVLTSPTNGNVLTFNGTNWVNGSAGAVSGVQPYDAGLDSLSTLTGPGFVTVSADGNTYSARTLVAGTGISISTTNGSANPSIANTGVLSLAVPSFLNASAATGAVSVTLASQTAGLVFAGPTTGTAQPSFRTLAYGDLPISLYAENRSSEVAPVASGANAVALGSAASATRSGELAHASGQFATAGDAQSISVVLRNSTSDATLTELFADGSSARVVLSDNTAMTYEVQVVGFKTDGSAAAGYRFDGVILRGTGAANTSMVGSPAKNILGETVAAWDSTVVADTTNGALSVKVTGAASTSIKWVATVRATQVKV